MVLLPWTVLQYSLLAQAESYSSKKTSVVKAGRNQSVILEQVRIVRYVMSPTSFVRARAERCFVVAFGHDSVMIIYSIVSCPEEKCCVLIKPVPYAAVQGRRHSIDKAWTVILCRVYRSQFSSVIKKYKASQVPLVWVRVAGAEKRTYLWLWL